MNLQYFAKSPYGRTSYYLVDSEAAAALALITNRKTLHKSDMVGLEKLGHTFELVLEPNNQ